MQSIKRGLSDGLLILFTAWALCVSHDTPAQVGEWITPPYNAGDFTGFGGMGVHVPQKTIGTCASASGVCASKGFEYRIDTSPSGQQTMTVMFYIDPITITGPVSGAIAIRIPAGRVAASYSLNPVYIMDAHQAGYIGYACVIPGAREIVIAKVIPGTLAGGNFNLSNAATNVLGEITFRLQ